MSWWARFPERDTRQDRIDLAKRDFRIDPTCGNEKGFFIMSCLEYCPIGYFCSAVTGHCQREDHPSYENKYNHSIFNMELNPEERLARVRACQNLRQHAIEQAAFEEERANGNPFSRARSQSTDPILVKRNPVRSDRN